MANLDDKGNRSIFPTGVVASALKLAIAMLLILVSGTIALRYGAPEFFKLHRHWLAVCIATAPPAVLAIQLGIGLWRYLFRLASYVQTLRNYTVENIEPLRVSIAAPHEIKTPEPDKFVPRLTDEDEKTLGKRERDTLLRIIIGMAIKGYNHKPNALRNSTPKEISDDLKLLGMNVSDDTIRKFLKEAAENVLPGNPNSEQR